jgi:hypothetical protein
MKVNLQLNKTKVRVCFNYFEKWKSFVEENKIFREIIFKLNSNKKLRTLTAWRMCLYFGIKVNFEQV